MFTFLFGAPGSGKTAYIMDKIRTNIQNGQKTYLLVPEQQQFISECMLQDLPPSSALYFEIIGFSRLCEIVFSEYGGISDASVGSGTKNLIMWQSLREMSDHLSQYRGIKTDAAFVDMMRSSIDELRASSVTPADCETAALNFEEPILRRKLSDIAAIYQMYNIRLEECMGSSALMSEDKLKRLAIALSKHDFFSGTEIFIDSFTDFTGVEFDVIEQIILQAKSVCMSFAYNRGDHSPHTLTISDTVKRLTRFVRSNNIECLDLKCERGSSSDVSELDIIERHLWDFSIKKNDLPSPVGHSGDAVESYICENEFEEAWLAALCILKAHRSGTRYSEIAVIARNPENIRGIIESVFESAGIPYFLSEKTDLSATAPSRLILSALRCISHNFNLSDVINLMKTGLCSIDRHDADLFEDYCYTWNINGKMFFEDTWSMNPDGYTTEMTPRGREILLAANRVRSKLIPPLMDLGRALARSDGDTVESCRAIHSYLDGIGLSQNLCELAEFLLSAGNIKEAGELLRIYDFIISALTDICTVMGDKKVSVEELYCAVEIMLKNTDIASVPAINDCVTVGSAATLRVENIKVAIVLGLCEGEFPAAFSDCGILNEADKQQMDRIGISLASREDKITSDELFFVYRALTKPKEKLIISTLRSSISGGARSPSTAFNRVHFLLPHLKDTVFDLARVRSVARLLSQCESDISDSDIDAAVREVNDGTQDQSIVRIDPAFVRLLFGDNLHLSKSKISAFAECPYKYWCDYVLALREKKVSEIKYDSAGTIVHYVLEHLVKRLLKPDGSLEYITDQELIENVNDIINNYIKGISCPLPPYVMYNFSKLRDLTLIMAQSLVEEFAASSFKVVGVEQHISDRRNGALKPMIIRVDENAELPIVSLGGVIDRVDCFDDGERKYLRIVDYKTGSHKFDIQKIESGEDLQLPAYLFTAALDLNKSIFGAGRDEQIVPASALFFSAEEGDGRIDPVRSGFILNEDAVLCASSPTKDPKILAGISYNKDGNLSSKSRAAVSAEVMDEIRSTLKDTISMTAKNMYSGNAPRTPSKNACQYCSQKSSCPVANKD